MVYEERIAKYSADKIFLLGLFAVSLLIASMIVRAKTAISLSEPITLRHSGLSVRVPSGRGWKTDAKWQHDESTFVVSSTLSPRRTMILAEVKCTYHLYRPSDTPQMASFLGITGADIEVVDSGTLRRDALTIDWALLEPADGSWGKITATIELASGRALVIEIAQNAGEEQIVRPVFERMIEEIEFEDNTLLAEGKDIVAQIKSIGADRLMHQPDQVQWFLIKDSSGRDIGFTLDASLNSPGAGALQMTGFAYLGQFGSRETISSFRSDQSFDNFIWSSESSSRVAITASEVAVSDGKELRIQRTGTRGASFEARIGPAAVPLAVIEALYSQMLANNMSQVIVDIIESYGQIKPALVSINDAPAGEQPAEKVLTLEYIGSEHTKPTRHEFFFDAQMQVVQRILRHDRIYLFQRASFDDVANSFGAKAESALQEVRTLANELP